MSIEVVLLVTLGVVIIIGLVWILYPAWLVYVAHNLEWYVEYLFCEDDSRSDTTMSHHHQQQRQSPPLLSLIIPAYNEQDRIAIMLQTAHEYLTSPKGLDLLRRLQTTTPAVTTSSPAGKTLPVIIVEWIIVNDGSKDETCQVVRSTYKDLVRVDTKSTSSSTSNISQWKIVTLEKNSGKGAAVKTGMVLATGQYHLMVDADGATDFGPGLERLVEDLQGAMGLSNSNNDATRNNISNKETTNPSPTTMMVAAFGSRAHLEKDSTVKRSFVRTVLMKAFHFFVSLFVSSKIHDTQCGFKLFTQESSTAIFQTLHLRRWAFDTEIVLLCNIQKIRIVEVNIPWQEVDGSKLSTSKWALAVVSVTMLRDMICVRMCYTLGIWNVKTSPLTNPLQATKKQR